MTDKVHAVKQFAKTVRKRTPTFPARGAWYFDCTPWGGGYTRCGYGPGAAVLNDSGQCLNLSTGEVYFDARFAKEAGHE